MQKFKNVFIRGVGHFLPGPKVDCDEMDQYIGLINKQSQRIKRRILGENGIQTRHYGIDSEGKTLISLTEMGAEATRRAIEDADLRLEDIDFIATGTVSGDVVVPGLSNMLQGELGAPPLETLSVNGICSSGMTALKMAASQIESGEHAHAVVNATEFPSRLFKKTRFEKSASIDFSSHFLRWMLSDGAGTFVVSNKGKDKGLQFRLKWMHNKSFSGDFPTCMCIGFDDSNSGKSYLDYDSVSDAEAHSQFFLRQDIRLLPNLFEVGFAEYLSLVKAGEVKPLEVDHFLAHYSSERFSHTIKDLMKKSDAFIPEDRWYSNLSTSGNMGAASIFVMLSEFLKEKQVKAGEKILLFVPESGRFSVSFAMIEVEEAGEPSQSIAANSETVDPPIPDSLKNNFPHLFLSLSEIWSEYRSETLRTGLAKSIFSRTITPEIYKQWMSYWIPQVREGAVWMRNAIAHLPDDLKELAGLIETHAGEEQFDFNILYKDYKNLGGALALDDMQRSPGGEALHNYMLAMGRSNPIALLGGIFIIEGTGQKIIPSLLPFLKDSLGQNLEIYRFLQYHGENDENHLERWSSAVSLALDYSPEATSDIIDCAQQVSLLYRMQWNNISRSVGL